MNITLSYPAWFIILCALLAGLSGWFFYYKDTILKNIPASPVWTIALSTVRGIIIFFIALLMLSPVLKFTDHHEEKPIIALIQDNSESIEMAMGKDTAAYSKSLNKLALNLGDKYEVRRYTCGDKLRDTFKLDYNSPSTNLSGALGGLSDEYYGRNLGAVILATDGIFNQGSSPLYNLAALNAPVYTIALGDTTPHRDLILQHLNYNKIVYLNNNFTIRADIKANGLGGKHSTLTVFKVDANNQTQKVQETNVDIANNTWFNTQDVLLKADKLGVLHFRFVLGDVPGELTNANNAADAFIEVLDARQKVLVLANAPHPDLATLKNSIESNQNYEAEVHTMNEWKGSLNDYSLVILHNLPSRAQAIGGLMQQITKSGKPVLFIVGGQTAVAQFNSLQDLLSISGNRDNTNEVTPAIETNFNLFTLDDATVQAIAQMPPLLAPYGEYRLNGGATWFMKQRIGSVKTSLPLWAFYENANTRMGVICGEGLWRWRVYNFMQNKNYTAFDEVISKTVQYLSLKADKRQFRVHSSKSVFAEDEPVLFDAQLLNETAEPITDPDIALNISNAQGKAFTYIMDKSANGYVLNAGFLPAGNYAWTAKTTYNNKQLTAAGALTIAPVQLEATNLTADHQLLHNMAVQSGGRMVYPSNMADLVKLISQKESVKPVIYTSHRSLPAIHLKWVFFLLVALLSIEWFWRKYWGGY